MSAIRPRPMAMPPIDSRPAMIRNATPTAMLTSGPAIAATTSSRGRVGLQGRRRPAEEVDDDRATRQADPSCRDRMAKLVRQRREQEGSSHGPTDGPTQRSLDVGGELADLRLDGDRDDREDHGP